MIKARLDADQSPFGCNMARFIGVLNRDIQDRVEMEHYVEMEELLQKSNLVEQQLKRKITMKPAFEAS